MQNATAISEKNLGVSYEVKHALTIRRHLSTKRKSCTQIFVAAYLESPQTGNNPNVHQLINKQLWHWTIKRKPADTRD